MVKLTFVASSGTSLDVDAEDGASLMETAVRNMVPEIDGECGGACACATCHIYVHDDWTAAVGKPDQSELDMLSLAHDVRPNSRLACQIKVAPHLEGLVAFTPSQQA